MNKSLAGLIIPLLSLMVFASCGHSKKLATTNTAADTANHITTAATPVTNMPDSTMLKAAAIMSKTVNFTTFNGKAKVHYSGKDQKQDLSANIRIKKDSVIWVSVTALGLFPVARLLVTPDSIKLINYIDKEVTILSAADGSKLLNAPIDFGSLQNLLMGNQLSNKGSFGSLQDTAATWIISLLDTTTSLLLTYNKTDTTLTSQFADIKSTKPQSIKIDQWDYNVDKKSGILFSKERHIIVQNGTDLHDIEINYNGIDFNEPEDFPFNISDKFTRKTVQ